jgi:hypothetical protein
MKALSNSVKYLFLVGALGQLIACWLFWRMIVAVNKMLPSGAKRISLLEGRQRFQEIKRLHEASCPTSALRTAWFTLTVMSTSLSAIAIILAVKPP